MKTMLFLLINVLLFPSNAHSASKGRVEDVSYSQEGDLHYFDIHYRGREIPQQNLSFRSNLIQLTLPNTVTWPKQEKSINIEHMENPILLTAYQFDRKTSRFRVIFDEKITIDPKSVSLFQFGDRVRISWKKPEQEANLLQYDESYLEKLVTEQMEKDQVTSRASAIERGPKKSGFNEYLVRYISIVFLFIGGFWLLLNLFRKGVMKKGKLNFLRNTGQIEQVSSMYISPKRSLHLIKSAGQMFLIGSTDQNISLISEIQSQGLILKEAEKILTGDNFETELESQKKMKNPKEFPLKTDIKTSHAQDEFVSQLKEKIKGLKSFQ